MEKVKKSYTKYRKAALLLREISKPENLELLQYIIDTHKTERLVVEHLTSYMQSIYGNTFTQAETSTILAALRSVGLVEATPDSRWRVYAPTTICDVLLLSANTIVTQLDKVNG